MSKIFKYLAIAILLVFAAWFFYNKYRVAPGLDFKKLNLTDLNGNPVKFEDFKGKKLIVSFGASWCGNCISELKDLTQIKDELAGIEVLIISDEPLETVVKFKERKSYPFTFLKMEQSFGSIGINSIPTNYIFNKNLELKYEKVGEINYKDFSTLEYIKKQMED
ncbi:MAG: TlpA family protein disulfide reductase [Bacteroidetes bacterium]|nr:TlpA family protein disulfide reductase [Bacteroidota bacterium]